jgi:hypothetical protein
VIFLFLLLLLDKQTGKTFNRGMGQRDDIDERIKKSNPQVHSLFKEIDKNLLKSGYRGAIVTANHDMTEDEEGMALFEGFLREGYPEEEASMKAKEWLFLSKRL